MGKFEHKQDGTIVINSVKMPLGLFLRLEPSYTLPAGAKGQTYVQGKGRHIVAKTPYRITGSWGEGDRYISREREFAAAMLTESLEYKEARDLVAKVEAKRRTSQEKRKAEYPSIDELVVALWKHIVEGKSLSECGASDLQAVRESVKSKYPKENDECQLTPDKNSSTTVSDGSVPQSSKSTSMKSKSKTASKTRSNSSQSTRSTGSKEST